MPLTMELLLHPIRMRIIQSFIPDKELTASQIIDLIPDIPQASLYRHLSILAKANITEVVAENRVRGTLEKTYKLKQANIPREDLEKMAPEEHVEAFFTFTTHLLAEFSNYVHQENIDFYTDGVMYRQASVYLDDDEFKEWLDLSNKISQKFIENKPRPGRKLRTIATIIIPK